MALIDDLENAASILIADIGDAITILNGLLKGLSASPQALDTARTRAIIDRLTVSQTALAAALNPIVLPPGV